MTSLHDEMKARCERALRGERNNEDFYRIIMWLRSKSEGSIRDLGDFLAHFDERNKGASTEEMTDYLLASRLKFRGVDQKMSLHHGKPYFAFDKMPNDFVIGLKAAVRIIGVPRLSQTSGIQAARIPLMLSDIFGKAFVNLDGTMSLYERCTDEERGLLRNIMGNNDIRGLYKLDDVFDEFIASLLRFNLISKKDTRIQTIKNYFGIFICKSIDGCVLKRSGIKAKLKNWVSREGKLLVMAESLLIKTPAGGSIIYSAPFFWTEIEASKVMDGKTSRILSNINSSRGILEISSAGNLVFI